MVAFVLCLLTSTAMVASGAVVAIGQDAIPGWPMTGRDAAHTGTADGPAPPYREAWRTSFPGGLAAGPVVVEGIVIGLGRDRIVALDARSGETVWEAERSTGRSGSPGVSGGLVIHASGRESESSVVARSLDDGRERWRVFPGSSVRAGLVAEGERVYAATVEGEVLALDVVDGEEAWRLDLDGSVEAAPAVSEGVLVVALEQRSAGTSAVVAVDTETGEEEWRFTSLPSGAGATPPSVADGVAYVGAADARVHALDLDTGAERWSTRTQSTFVLPPPVFTASQVPAVAADPIVADIAHLERFDARTGRERWSFRFLDGLYRSGVAAVGGYALVGDFSGGLSAVDLDSGLLVWEIDLGRGPATSPAADGVRVYAGLVGLKDTAEPSPGSDAADEAAARRIGSIVALEHDSSEGLQSVQSESTLFPLRAVLGFLGAALAVILVSMSLFRFALEPKRRAQTEESS
jgi:outer membrane protein assembly factor BamB